MQLSVLKSLPALTGTALTAACCSILRAAAEAERYSQESSQLKLAATFLAGVLSAHVVCDVSKTLAPGSNFFRNERSLRMGLQGALQSDVGGASAHKPDAVPVLAC